MVYFIADLHLGHENIIRYCDRPFKTTDEMNRAIIKCWNNTVSRQDKVFVLGDFSLGTKEETIEWGRSLQGSKTLILGNHDRRTETVYKEAGFKEVIRYPILWNEYYILSHAPKFVAANTPYANIFGHVHNSPEYTDYSERSFCVSAERINYAPVSFETITKKMKHALD